MAKVGIYCKKCGYDLQGQGSGEERRCPECGHTFDPGNKRTFRRHPPAPWWWRWIRGTATALIVLSALLVGTWGWLYCGYEEQARALEKLHSVWATTKPIGGQMLFRALGQNGWVLLRAQGVGVSPMATDADMASLAELPNLEDLDLRGARITDSGLKSVKDLHRLRKLNLSSTRITDAGLENLKNLDLLEELSLSKTKVGDPGLKSLRFLTRLKKLDLQATKVTDAGMEDVGAKAELEELALAGTSVTDAGLASVSHLKHLRVFAAPRRMTDLGLENLMELNHLELVSLQDTQVTRAAVTKLRSVFPKVEIWWP